jgi:transcriptional regulator with XRE-family HTH domain/KaiC/GvpD/RAD55 family RecA-like ATPase
MGTAKTVMDAGKKTIGQISTGISYLDSLMGHLTLGDNVIWYDASGRQAWPFSFRFVHSSYHLKIPVLYVTFDESPRDLLSQLGPLANNPLLTILDCFSWGKGEGSEDYLSFYYENRARHPGRIVRVDDPSNKGLFSETLWGLHAASDGELRLVFDSLTGMQNLWGDEKAVLDFYRATCPKLYELETVSYWIVKSDTPSSVVRNHLNEIAQVAIDLTMRKGKEFLIPLKMGNRAISGLRSPYKYWIEEDHYVAFEGESSLADQIELPHWLKKARTMRGISQVELAKRVQVVASTISQIESNLILPSIPTLLKIAEALSVHPSFFFQKRVEPGEQLVFSPDKGKEIALPHVPSRSVVVRNVIPMGLETGTDMYLIEIPPGSKLSRHFLMHKGQEIGCVLSGGLEFTLGETVHEARSGDVVYLRTDVPDAWQNPGTRVAKLLWITMK